MKKLFLILLIFTNCCLLFSQGQDTVYINNTAISGTIKGSPFRSSLVKIVVNDKTKRFDLKKVDSLYYNDATYYMRKTFLTTNLIKPLESKKFGLYEMNGNITVLKRQSNVVFPISKRRYNKALALFSNQPKGEKIDLPTLTNALEKLELSSTQINTILDSALFARKAVTFRLSILAPSVGIETKITDNISFHTSAGLSRIRKSDETNKTVLDFNQLNEIRFFINQKKRIEKGKSSYNYSGFYAAPAFVQNFIAGNKPTRAIGATLGWQDNVIFNKTFGSATLGTFYDLENERVILQITYAFGWAL